MSLLFRRYQAGDRSHCLEVFDSNVPRYFLEHDRKDFESFIDTSGEPYFVVTISNGVLGCGGYGIHPSGDLADLCWGMVASIHHGKHLGELLLLGRLNEIAKHETVCAVRLSTSQHIKGFFQRYGFVTQSHQRDGYARGLDQVEMRLDFNAERREQLLGLWRKTTAHVDT